MKFLAACVAVMAVMLCSCGDGHGSMLPKSGGRPYEVLVLSTGDGNASGMINSILSRDVDGLPQPEPLFDVSLTDSIHFNQVAKLARIIIIVNVDSGLFTMTGIRYEKNVWARPQVVVYINTPSCNELQTVLPDMANGLVNLLGRFELNASMSLLTAGSNANAGAMVDSMFGCALKVPADMKAFKRGNGFIWVSDNAPGGMQNICVYSYPGVELSAQRALYVRDSVMKENIQGERPGSYMRTLALTVKSGTVVEHGRTVMITRGLWEMEGDAMGGPFVSHSIVDSSRRRIIVAEGFVYAPGMKKRNLLRQLEASLYTLKLSK